ncbi:hypothetical protein [Flavobacterium sangjuense]|uniref:Uncharacterized protein n=1 Tax=Flavobacterium sangjuense TaxID=2518177 RepID=A0A4V1CC70_9FLAO|nr:hypothetical protein [Flavobacterium sangjuense]QBZ98454.1 hypothetical protein GS03_01959 [Flavobacterium sangjuense]
MKKVILFVCVAVLSVNGFSQKKKSTTASALPKVDNLQVEIKKGNFQVTISEKGKTDDALVVKAVDASFAPTNCKLSSFTASGVKLYLLSWTELSQIKSVKKTEDRTTIYSVIYEITSKKQVYSNYQLTNHITEIVSLGGTAATETQEKMRREGFEFVLNPDGSIIQKNKTQQSAFVYDKDKMVFVPKKK